MKAYIFLQNQLDEADPTKKTSDQLIKENTDSQMASVQSMFAQPLRYNSFWASRCSWHLSDGITTSKRIFLCDAMWCDVM
jgi:hypothetical protein